MAKGKFKITDQDIKFCQGKGMKILEIAEEFGVTAYTVMRKIQKMETHEHRREFKENQGEKNGLFCKDFFKTKVPVFDLRVGDIVSAIETEITPARRRYRITEIYRDVYIGERMPPGGKGTWKTAFQKKDYRRGHDPNLVKLVSRGGVEV